MLFYFSWKHNSLNSSLGTVRIFNIILIYPYKAALLQPCPSCTIEHNSLTISLCCNRAAAWWDSRQAHCHSKNLWWNYWKRLHNLSNVTLDYEEQRTGDKAAVAFGSVMLQLCSNITTALKAKIYHFVLKLASLLVSNQQGNYQFRKLSLQGSCFIYPSCLPLLGLSCSSRKQSCFTRTCFTFLVSLPVTVQRTAVSHAGEERVKNCCQTGFSSPPWYRRGADAHPNPNPAIVLPGALEMWPELHLMPRSWITGPNSPSW